MTVVNMRLVGDEALDASALRAQLDCLPVTVVRIDALGRITYVNEAWRQFARANGADAATCEGIGLNYLDVCPAGDPTALSAREGVRDLLEGRADSSEVVYRCHSVDQRRWFRMTARRVSESDSSVVVTHIDVTALHLAETRSQIQASVSEGFAARRPFLESCRDLALSTCHKLEWDYMGIWTLDPASWTLRCADLWIRPECDVYGLERATRIASLGPGVGLPGRAWSGRAAVWVTDRDHDPKLVGAGPSGAWTILPTAVLAAGFNSGFAFPLKCDDDVLAVVEILGRIRECADPALLHVLEVSGNRIALGELRGRAELRAEAAQAEADAAREHLEAVMECAPTVIVAVDERGAIQFVNKAPPGRTKEELIGTAWTEHVPSSEQPQIRSALESVLSGGVPHKFEINVPAPDGQGTCYANYMGPMRSAYGITGAVLISEDVTELRRAQVELSSTQRLASIGTLAAGVAHEINTPLQYIGDNIEFLRDASIELLALVPLLQSLCTSLGGVTLTGEPQAALGAVVAAQEDGDLPYLGEHVPKALERCVDGLERVTTIVRSLKEFSHPAQDHMAAVDLNRAVMATVTVALSEYKYVADLEVDLGELPPVVCHVNQINQAVLNILINASHAIADFHRGTDTKGHIYVRTRREGEFVVIAIRDTAGGIPEAVRPRIFDPFFTTKEVGRGTGQGLTIAWATVTKVHGGTLSFETTLGQGTEFFIRLPVDGKPQADSSHAEP